MLRRDLENKSLAKAENKREFDEPVLMLSKVAIPSRGR